MGEDLPRSNATGFGAVELKRNHGGRVRQSSGLRQTGALLTSPAIYGRGGALPMQTSRSWLAMHPAEIGESGRIREAARNRRAALAGGSAFIARIVAIGTSLITVPLTVHYLGNERFGLWMAISSALAMANFADFGIGNGMLNAVADAHGKEDYDRIRQVISSSFTVLSAVGAVLLALFAASFCWVRWEDVFRVSSGQARAEAAPALLVFAACFALNMPLDVVQRAQLGLQQGLRMSLWQICGSGLALVGVIAGIRLHVGLPFLVAALAGAPVAVVALNALHYFTIVRPELRPHLRYVSREVISRILRLGGFFFLLQAIATISYSADNLIIARTLGAASVTVYSIPQRMFSLVSILIATLVTPLWPAYGEAVSRGDMAWVRRALIRSLIMAFGLATIGSLTLLLMARQLILWWIGPVIAPPFILLLGLALWTIVESSANAVSMFLCGASMVRIQLVIASIFGICCLILKVLLTRRYGIAGVPWATLTTHFLIADASYAIYVPRALRHLRRVPRSVCAATPVIGEQM